MTEDCKNELWQFKIDRATNVNKNLPLGMYDCCVGVFTGYPMHMCASPITAQACKKDVHDRCKNVDVKDEGAVLACLRYVLFVTIQVVLLLIW